MIKKNKAAMELSIGTVVVIVISMIMLILGVVLVREIFVGGKKSISALNDQVASEINKLFGEDKKLVIFPVTKQVEVTRGNQEGFAIGIKNKLTGSASRNALFSYVVTPDSDVEKDCGISKEEVMDFFVAGSNKGENIPIPTGESEPILVLFETGEGDPLCTIRFRVDVMVNGANYDYTYVFVRFRD